MKFSSTKKAQMRKRRQKRVDKIYSNPIGISFYDPKSDSICTVEDVARINKVVYLFAISRKKEVGIYKIVDIGNYVKLSEKRLLEKKKNFEISQNWEKKTSIVIDDDGKIVA